MRNECADEIHTRMSDVSSVDSDDNVRTCVGGAACARLRASLGACARPLRNHQEMHQLLRFVKSENVDEHAAAIARAVQRPNQLDVAVAALMREFGFEYGITSVAPVEVQSTRTLSPSERARIASVLCSAHGDEILLAACDLPSAERAVAVVERVRDNDETLTNSDVADTLLAPILSFVYGVQVRGLGAPYTRATRHNSRVVYGEPQTLHLVQVDGLALWSAAGARSDDMQMKSLRALNVARACTLTNALMREQRKHRPRCKTFADVVNCVTQLEYDFEPAVRNLLAIWCREQMCWRVGRVDAEPRETIDTSSSSDS
jgi:hypothetical protein